MIAAVGAQPAQTGAVVGRTFDRIRVGGGGSQSKQICQAIANATGLPVISGPSEVTVLGNLALQFIAQGELNWTDLPTVLERSAETTRFEP